MSSSSPTSSTKKKNKKRRILVLHGSRQTGSLLLSRMDKLRKKLEKGLPERGGNDGGGEEEAISFELVAVDAPHEYVDEVDEELVFDDDDDNGGGNNSIKADTTTPSMLQWWRLEKAPPEDGRGAVRYAGLEVSLERVRSAWMVANGEDAADGCCCGILGFSQGARLAHLICVLHQQQHAAAVCSRNGDSKSYPQWHLPGLQFVILVAGYDASLPVNLFPTNDPSSSSGRRADEKSQTVDPTMLTVSGKTRIDIPSLHVWGKSDRLIVPEQSRELSFRYSNTQVHIHEGGHHVPMQAASIRAYLDFIQKSYYQHANADGGHGGACWNGTNCTTHNDSSGSGSHAVAETLQRRTVPASENLTSSPDPKEVATASTTTEPTAASSTTTPDNEVNDEEEARQAQHDELEAIQAIYPDEFHLLSRSPVIRYLIDLVPSDEGWWPPKLISLDIAYPVTYPINSSVGPIIKLLHDNNVMEFSSVQAAQLLSAVEAAAFEERGMCCVLSCLLAARDYFESGLASSSTTAARRTAINTSSLGAGTGNEDGEAADRLDEGANGGVPAAGTPVSKIKASTPDRIKECNVHGLAIAESILKQQQQLLVTISENEKNRLGGGVGGGKRGAWTYTIGLVGKPSAGKSTFFNVATAFARQRDDAGNALGGATMAPHPFTTIDPNVGYCLVPAPEGSCPEDGYAGPLLPVGSTHGRDPLGRRLIPVLLKDVAGLVPGAFQGRGRGNKFLNDLTDADVLIHVVDGSGQADSEGNIVGIEGDGLSVKGATHPLHDLAWIRDELIEWVYSNVLYKWDAIRAKGQQRLAKMFSGYGQSQAVTMDVLSAVERHMEAVEGRDCALSNLHDWDEADLHRLVSAFLGVRFPMALAINKYDVSTSPQLVKDILDALPIHGAHAGVPMCAKREMQFVRSTICKATKKNESSSKDEEAGKPPKDTWQCLHEAMALKPPVLVFPVIDFVSYAPLPGLNRYATEDSSLPSAGMVACIQQSRGSAPSLWNDSQKIYVAPSRKYAANEATTMTGALRDVLVMKPGSTIDDCYHTLKRLGAVAGEFVRAEATSDLGVPPKPVPKHHVISKNVRIVKIMTKKKSAWQKAP